MKKFALFLVTAAYSLPLFAENGAEEPPAPPSDTNFWQPIVMVAIGALFFYFILMRPEQRRRKEAEAKRSTLQKGDKVTAMGILGTVARVDEATVVIQLYDGAKMEVLKGAITDVVSGGAAPAEKK